MKLSIVMLAAAAVYASPADDQAAALAPDQEGEMKQLLSMDSFNITSADSEQNRMHAVCDMEYRLSKMTGNRGLATMNLASANTNAAALFNPFTMPLMAVKQHIALLQQEEKFLQAQSDAFSGSSSSATTATPSTVAISKCQFFAKTGTTSPATPSAVGSRLVDDSLEIAFTTQTAAAVNQILQVTVDVGGTETVTFTNPTPAMTGTAFGAGTSICQNIEGTDGPCKNAAGAAMSTTGDAAIAKPTATMNPEGTASGSSGTVEVATASAKDVKAGNKGIIFQYSLKEGLDVMKSSYWYMGVIGANSASSAAKPWTVTMEFLQGTAAAATLTGKATCTTSN